MTENKKLVKILIAIIVVLAIAVLYAFVVKPRVSGYAVENQIQGYNTAVLGIAQVAKTCQTVPVPLLDEKGTPVFDENNQTKTINLIAVECLQQPQNQEQSTPATGTQ